LSCLFFSRESVRQVIFFTEMSE